MFKYNMGSGYGLSKLNGKSLPDSFFTSRWSEISITATARMFHTLEPNWKTTIKLSCCNEKVSSDCLCCALWASSARQHSQGFFTFNWQEEIRELGCCFLVSFSCLYLEQDRWCIAPPTGPAQPDTLTAPRLSTRRSPTTRLSEHVLFLTSCNSWKLSNHNCPSLAQLSTANVSYTGIQKWKWGIFAENCYLCTKFGQKIATLWAT